MARVATSLLALVLLLRTVAGGEPAAGGLSVDQQAKLWGEGITAAAKQQTSEALAALQRLAHAERQASGGSGYTLAHLLELITELQKQRGDWNGIPAPQPGVLIRARIDTHLADPQRAAGAAARLERLAQVVARRRQVFGAGHSWVGLALLDLAAEQQRQGRLEDAAASWEQALHLFEKRAGAPGTAFWREDVAGRVADARSHLAEARLRQGKAEQAETLVREDLRRPKGFEYVRSMSLLAEILLRRGDLPELRKIPWNELIAVSSGVLGNAGAHLSEQEHLDLVASQRGVIDRYFSFLALGEPGQPVNAFAITNRKGSVFIEQSRRRTERAHPKLAPLFDRHDAVSRELAALVPGTHAAGKDEEKVRALMQERAGLEVQIGRVRRTAHLPMFMNAPPSTYLAASTVLLDFWQYDGIGADAAKGGSGPRLACLVHRKDAKAPVLHVDLGPAAPVTEAVKRWRAAIKSGKGGRGFAFAAAEDQEDAQAPRFLRERLWAPLEPYLATADLVLLSPDGDLSFVPFAALPGAKPGTFLIEERAFAYVPVPQLIKPYKSYAVKVPAPDPDRPRMLLVGDVDFSAAGTGGATGPSFAPLPGTAKEIDLIARQFRKVFPAGEVDALTGERATREALRERAAGRQWLHLATHAYFLPTRTGLQGEALGARLVLADGPMTALEATGLDLSGTELAVLSACETSLGTVERGEGVRGLQMAFQLAGARSVIATLWQVHDEATQALMVEFYRNRLERRLGTLEALRRAQLSLLRGELYRPPSAAPAGRVALPPMYWAAFVLSGDTR